MRQTATISKSASRAPAAQSDRYLRLLESLSPLIGSHCVDDLCASACRLLADVLRVEACSIFIFDSTTKSLVLRAATHIPKPDWKSVRLPTDSGLCGHVFRAGKPTLLRKAADFKQFGMTPRSRYGKASCIVAPLLVRCAQHGVINIANPRDGRLFNHRDVKLIEAACRLISAGILNAYQFHESVQIHEHLEGIFDNLHIGILALTPDLVVTHSNHRFREMMGDPSRGLKGRNLKDFLAPAVYSVCRRLIRDSSEQQKICQDRITGEIGGGERALEITALGVNCSATMLRDCLLMIEDVGQDEEVKRLREADSAKRGFLRIISHELRTPLTVIRGVIPLIECVNREANGSPSQTLVRVEQLVKNNVQKLTGIVNSILDVVEIESGSIKLAMSPTDVNALIEERLAFLRDAGAQKRIEWKLELSPELPQIPADRPRLGQVIHELLDNAVKFSPAGGDVQVATQLRDGMATVRIANRGGPIPPKQREEVFEKFYQIDSSATRKSGGCGLGLYLARNIASLHGGSLAIAEGESDQAAFELSLPIHLPSPHGG